MIIRNGIGPVDRNLRLFYSAILVGILLEGAMILLAAMTSPLSCAGLAWIDEIPGSEIIPGDNPVPVARENPFLALKCVQLGMDIEMCAITA